MKTEHKELSTKLSALNAFIYGNEIFKTLHDREKELMIKQSAFMEAYAGVLSQRIWVS